MNQNSTPDNKTLDIPNMISLPVKGTGDLCLNQIGDFTKNRIESFFGFPLSEIQEKLNLPNYISQVKREDFQNKENKISIPLELENLEIGMTIHDIRKSVFQTVYTVLIRKCLEDKLEADYNTLFRTIAHDVKNPLGNVMNFLDLILQNLSTESEKIKKFIEIASTEAKKTYKILEMLLHWAKQNSKGIEARPTECSLQEMILDGMEYAKVEAEKKEISLRNETIGDTLVFADKTMITTVIQNLLRNGVKFTKEGGEVSIKWIQEDGKTKVIVRDTGIGIKPESLKKLFLKNFDTTFGTAGEKGTGLGLKICKQNIELNGGEIFVESEEGNGSRFIFTIPNNTRDSE